MEEMGLDVKQRRKGKLVSGSHASFKFWRREKHKFVTEFKVIEIKGGRGGGAGRFGYGWGLHLTISTCAFSGFH